MAGKKGKGGKGKKEKGKMKKFDLDLFGILTFTRYHGEPFENFMYTPDKKAKGGKGKDAGGKGKGKKGKKKPPENVPKIEHFPPVPEDPTKDRKLLKEKKLANKEEPDVIIPTTSIGFKEKTTRPAKPFNEGGSISDVMCGKKYPLPPRPLPHGGVYGDPKCVECKGTGGLLKTIFGTLHKKMRSLLNNEFDKAEYIITWLTEKIQNTISKLEDHMKGILDELGPVLDNLDESEWDDHFEVRALVEKWRAMKKELDRLRAELKQFIKNREEEIAKAVAEKLREMDELERLMIATEKRMQELAESLRDWQENAAAKISGPEAEIAALLERLRMIRESVYNEKETLRQLLSWEMAMATENTVTKMEEIVRQDLDVILGWMHPAWFRLFLENKKMQEERSRLRMENHLLELEVQTLARQVDQMEINQREMENTKTHFITPPNLNDRVDRFTRYLDDFAILQLTDYPTTRLIHE